MSDQTAPIEGTTPVDGLDREEALALLHGMVRIRRFEERCAELYSAGVIRGFVHLCVGEEAVSVGAVTALGPDDAIVSTYREHGHALAHGLPMDAVMAEMYGRVDGVSRGRGGSMHLFDADRRFYGGNAIVAGGLPIAVGLALADREQGRDRVTACFFGEGAVDEGEFHESMNLAALWELPVLFLCENNLYSMGTAFELAEAQTDLVDKAASYSIQGLSVDGMDVVEVLAAVRAMARAVRSGDGPRFVELRTYRFRAHSMYDPELYRSKEEVEAWRRRDPITTFAAELRRAGLLDDEAEQAIDAAVAEELEAAVAFAEESPLEPVEDLLRFVVSEEVPA